MCEDSYDSFEKDYQKQISAVCRESISKNSKATAESPI
jgi:hypothetical protein